MKLRDVIRETTRFHLLNNNGLLYAQCVRAVGWIGGTVPELTEDQGIVELPTSDVSNGGIVCGSALAGRRPIYVIRYQGFITYNMCSILNYAAKSKEMWGVPCPVFVRGIGMEGGIGPVATGMHHSAIVRFPGIKVFAPMTPLEWKYVWDEYRNGDDPVYCSEHRLSFDNSEEIPDETPANFDTVVVLVGPTRLSLDKVRETYGNVAIVNVFKLKPFRLSLEAADVISRAKEVIIVDSDYTFCGLSEHIAYFIHHMYNSYCEIRCVGPLDKVAGFAPHKDNVTLIY